MLVYMRPQLHVPVHLNNDLVDKCLMGQLEGPFPSLIPIPFPSLPHPPTFALSL